jgi:hypothetical protein
VTTAERSTSKVATIPVHWGNTYHNSESLLFIRQDLLDQYLHANGLSLVLSIWGERRANYQSQLDARKLEGTFKIEDALHRQGFVYKTGAFERFL